MASLMMNGSMRPPSSLSDVSEESFVVLSRHLDGDSPDHGATPTDSLLATSIVCPSIPHVPITDAVSQSTSIMSTSTTSELSAEEIQAKLESLLQENLQLKGTLQQNNLAMKKQFSTLVMWQEDVMKVHQSHKEKFEETKKLITNLRAENAELKKSTSLPCSSSSKSEEETLSLKAKISALEFELDTLRQANIKFKNEQSKIIQELEIKLSESEKGRAEEVNKLNMQVDSVNKQLQAVEQQYQVVQRQLEESMARAPTQTEVEQREQERRQLSELGAELVLKNKLLKDKTQLIDELQEQVARLKGDNETIPILMRQVEIYKQDFNQEREARNGLKSERDRLAEDLRHLQRRNNQLLEEVERLRPQNFVYVPSAPTSQQQQQQQQQQASREEGFNEGYTCPKCNAEFPSYQPLENHVFRCLEEDTMYP